MINNGSILLVIIRIIDKLDFVIVQALKLSLGKLKSIYMSMKTISIKTNIIFSDASDSRFYKVFFENNF